jgi:hypothetical protein
MSDKQKNKFFNTIDFSSLFRMEGFTFETVGFNMDQILENLGNTVVLLQESLLPQNTLESISHFLIDGTDRKDNYYDDLADFVHSFELLSGIGECPTDKDCVVCRQNKFREANANFEEEMEAAELLDRQWQERNLHPFDLEYLRIMNDMD